MTMQIWTQIYSKQAYFRLSRSPNTQINTEIANNHVWAHINAQCFRLVHAPFRPLKTTYADSTIPAPLVLSVSQNFHNVRSLFLRALSFVHDWRKSSVNGCWSISHFTTWRFFFQNQLRICWPWNGTHPTWLPTPLEHAISWIENKADEIAVMNLNQRQFSQWII